MKHRDCDVIVVGGGHAGTEAVLAAERMGARVVLVTHRFDRLGVMSCNPAIGGLGKGHIVREIDALDGVMGRAGDEAGIQFRLLNRSKGPATQGLRVQADRERYRRAIRRQFLGRPQVRVIEGEVVDLVVEGETVVGVRLAGGVQVVAGAVVLTTGTFLRGVIHMGETTRPAGRLGDSAAVRLAERIGELALPLGRLKTGTPPRLDGRTIDWEAVGSQPGDVEPVMLSFLSAGPGCPQVECGVTETNARTHAIIRSNLGRSAMYSGRIEGVGPRYCPSIEDKVVRFADKEAHRIFLEPEGLDTPLVYPNGISTSLPPEVQEEYVRSIQGLEKAKITQPGYAIEYDYIDPRALDRTLAVRALKGLFLAGQINGTTGYEGAAGQGLLAGLNGAARALGRQPVLLDRSQAYIGVMVDDLVTRGVSEPYRMFTSRAEYRLQLRPDNADQRLTPLGVEIGCVGEDRRIAFEKKRAALGAAEVLAKSLHLSSGEAGRRGLGVNQDGVWRSAFELMGHASVGLEAIVEAFPELAEVPTDVLMQVRRDATYAPYLARQAQDIDRLRRDEAIPLPRAIDYRAIGGLSSELRDKLEATRPESLAQASRIEGMTPAALTQILLRARQGEREHAAG